MAILAWISNSAASRRTSCLLPCTQLWLGCTLSNVFRFGPLTTRKILRHWNVSREGQQSCEGSGAQVLWEVAEGTGMGLSGTEGAHRRFHHPYSATKGGCDEVGVSLCFWETVIGREVTASSCARGAQVGYQVGSQSSDAVAQLPKEVVWSPSPRVIQKRVDVALRDS